MQILGQFGDGLLMAAAMAWRTGWSLVLGFSISAGLQTLVSSDALRDRLGRTSLGSVSLATVAGAASSSCSYASASIMRTLFRKGAAFAPSLAFLVASTNLVVELGVVLWLLMGWRFAVAQWLGGLVLVAVLVPVSRILVGRTLVDAARRHEDGGGHEHGSTSVRGRGWGERLADPNLVPAVAAAFATDWRMLWKDLAAGFLIGGMLAAFVPDGVWQALFRSDLPGWTGLAVDVLVGPLVAVLSFVCSIGNVPLAAILWGSGVHFGGVLAFLYADLIILPLIDTYRRYFGLRMALAITATLYVSIVTAAFVVGGGFELAGLAPDRAADVVAGPHFAVDYTLFLNIVALVVAGWLFWTSRRKPLKTRCGHVHE